MVYTYIRGWKIVWVKNRWVYVDTGDPVNIERVCRKCRKFPTKEGHDACLGKLSNIKNACCGHGIKGYAYIQKKKRE